MSRVATILLSPLLLAGCNSGDGAPKPEPSPSPTTENAGEAVSILRPDVEQPEMVPIEPARLVVTFEEGSELSDAARQDLAELLETRAMKQGGAITIGGHSDAGGSDAVNQRISQERAEAVKEWLVAQGVDASRIETIAFGEQNPVAPNALPDGEPDEVGRAANRRVEVLVDVPAGATAQKVAPAPSPSPLSSPTSER